MGQERAGQNQSDESEMTTQVHTEVYHHPPPMLPLESMLDASDLFTSTDQVSPQMAATFREPVLAPQTHSTMYDAHKSGQEVRIRWSSRKSRQAFTLHESDAQGTRFRHYNHNVESM
jgi:hypothetical protein